MDRKTFWNEAARWGLVLGLLLSFSFIAEDRLMHSGSLKMYAWLLAEWLAVVVLHFWLLFRFVGKCASYASAEEGFSFGRGYGAVMAVSLMAGIIVGVVQTVYLHRVIGYSEYINQSLESMHRMLADGMGHMPNLLEGMVTDMMRTLQNTPVPSVLESVFGGIFSTLTVAAFMGLIVAGASTRAPQPFGGNGSAPADDAANDDANNDDATE